VNRRAELQLPQADWLQFVGDGSLIHAAGEQCTHVLWVCYNGRHMSPPLSKVPLLVGDLNPHLTHGFLDPHKSLPQMPPRSVQPFFVSDIAIFVVKGDVKLQLTNSAVFCTAHPCCQQTDTNSDHATSDICSNRLHRCGLIMWTNLRFVAYATWLLFFDAWKAAFYTSQMA